MPIYRESFLVRIACDPPARIWSGFGPLPVSADIVETEDSIYLGAGQIVSLPDLDQVMNGAASRIEATVSGASSEMIRLALEDAPSVKGAKVSIGRIDFDEHWQQIGDIEWEATLRADTLTVNSDQSEDGRTRSITLSISTEDTSRSRAPVAFFTDADQRKRSPTDAIFDFVASISLGTSRAFGPK